MLQLISATPSPYARKVRIALAEKNIPFELITEVPWNQGAITPQHNPLAKLPVLLVTAEAKREQIVTTASTVNGLSGPRFPETRGLGRAGAGPCRTRLGQRAKGHADPGRTVCRRPRIRRCP